MRRHATPLRVVAAAVTLAGAFGLGSPAAAATGSVIFVHPDGASAATWTAVRAAVVGPDGDLAWDQLPHVAVYRGHEADCLTSTSNAGGTTHAYGVKVVSGAYGRPDGGADPGATSVAHEAIHAGIPVGLVQSGTSTEPGTGCFLASVESRHDHAAIAVKLLESGATVILGGGERHFLPDTERGVYGAGARTDGRNLVLEAEAAGYTVVRTRAEMLAVSADTERLLGLFASNHTFNAAPEQKLAADGLPLYAPDAPTVGEMTSAALRILGRDGRQFLLVVEEEGTDNFGNQNNAAGVIEAARRADDAIAVARAYVHAQPNTLVLTAADSDAGGMRMIGMPLATAADADATVPAKGPNGAPMDGRDGPETAPFLSAPDRTGQRLPFAVTWAARDDVSGGVVVRAEGLNAEHVRGSFDNTDVARIIRLTLFGTSE